MTISNISRFVSRHWLPTGVVETTVIRFNNHIFTAAADYLNGVYQQQLGKDCEDLQSLCRRRAGISRSTEKGYVKVSFLEPDEEHDYTGQTLISLGAEVEHLLANGVRLNDIAILVTKEQKHPTHRRLF